MKVIKYILDIPLAILFIPVCLVAVVGLLFFMLATLIADELGLLK